MLQTSKSNASLQWVCSTMQMNRCANINKNNLSNIFVRGRIWQCVIVLLLWLTVLLHPLKLEVPFITSQAQVIVILAQRQPELTQPSRYLVNGVTPLPLLHHAVTRCAWLWRAGAAAVGCLPVGGRAHAAAHTSAGRGGKRRLC